ncbi:MAG: SUMF1/EgtB/PvdO family nonheme iron enzyme [Prevotellaceae bacterium]|jgi:formylglycine-generating enzyme required for sulfatase activity|nr:SUMF1/EgtB/PvdO family nonheme iron enzyme [Prevotellaceae bacterium]
MTQNILKTAMIAAAAIFIAGAASAQRHPAEPEMVFVEGGTFTMGCTAEQGSICKDNEKPAHSVTVNSFYIGKYEITQAQWESLMDSNPCFVQGASLPMGHLTWDSAQEFISRLNKATGKNYRLPTEAEWEYAARGGSRSKGYRYSGSNNLDEVAWYYNNSSDKYSQKPHSVGTKKPNELGIYDMSGNVSEFCYDWYGGYSASPQQNPTGPGDGRECVFRGGGNMSDAEYCRISFRSGEIPTEWNSNFGFRVALDGAVTTIGADTATVKRYHFAPKMVFVEGGTFTMGCTAEQGNSCDSDEKPAHKVKVGSFYISQYEITQEQWYSVLAYRNRSQFAGKNRPVEMVTWNDVQEYIARLNEYTGRNYRLPTEAEWEYAARGGNRSKGYRYSGSNNLDEVAWHEGNSERQTHDVGTKKPNELGIYDMSGNVGEWCMDFYGKYDASSKLRLSPYGYVVRGGYWKYDMDNCRVSRRYQQDSNYISSAIGFRLVLPVEE